MSAKKHRSLPKIKQKRGRREDDSDVNLNKKVNAEDNLHDLLTSYVSKPVTHRCILPEIGNGQLMKKQTGNKMVKHQRTGSGTVVLTHFPPLPVQAAGQQQLKKLSKWSSTSRHGFEDVPMLPAVVRQDLSKKEGSQLKQGTQVPVHLPPFGNVSSWAAGHKPEVAVLRPTTELNKLCKLPDIKMVKVKPSKPTSGQQVNQHKVLCELPSTPERKEEPNKNLKHAHL